MLQVIFKLFTDPLLEVYYCHLAYLGLVRSTNRVINYVQFYRFMHYAELLFSKHRA